MALFVKITPLSFWPWLIMVTKDAYRMISAKLRGAPGREEGVLGYVCEHAQQDDPESVLAAMDVYARSERHMTNVGVAKGAILEEAVQQSGAGRVLELGSYCGYSAIRIARLLTKDDSVVVSLEKSPEFAEIARQIIDRAGLTDRIELKVGEAGDIIPHLEGHFDLVFIDHWKTRYLADLLLIEKHDLLHEGSVVVADKVGIFEGAVRAYLNHVRQSEHYDTSHYDTHMEYDEHIPDGVEVSVWHNAPSH